jgi:hypothetical protein
MAKSQRQPMTPLKSRSNGRPVNSGHHDHRCIHVWLPTRQRPMIPISEASFQAQVKSLAYIHGWSLHHSQPSMTRTGRYITTGSTGFPDIVMAHEQRGLIFAELKTEKGKASEAQLHWLRTLHPHAECYLWRPSDIDFIAQRLAQC